jgi:hypothetical protein
MASNRIGFSSDINLLNGNLGIGTTNPQQKLHVLGNVLVAAGSSTDQYITLKPYELSNGTLSWEGSAGKLLSITNNLTSGSIFSVCDSSGIPSIDVDASGTIAIGPYGGSLSNVGIGTTNPQAKLDVSGSLRVSGVSTLGTVQVSSGIITASSGIVTYYGDGYNLIRTKQSYQFNNTLVGSGTTLNFIGAGVSSVILSNDVVTVNIPSTIRTVGLSTATLNQTTFSATYNLGFVDVYLNGSKLSQDQYTATDGLNIVLETGASLGDIVEIVGYMTYRVPGTQLILSDTVSSVSGITTSYTGLADQGSSQSASVWTIRRAVFTSAGITSSIGSASNVAWINRYSVTYT